MTTMELIEKGIGHNCLSDAYELGRADATKELPTRLYVDGFNDGYPKGRADAIDDYTDWLRKTHANFDENYAEDIKSDYLEHLKEQKND